MNSFFEATRYTLIGRAQDGREDGWRELWDVYGDYVRHRVRLSGAADSDVEDITQDVFVSVSRGIARFQPEAGVGSFRAWLKTVIKRRAADHFRKTGRTPGGVASATPGELSSLAADSETEDDLDDGAAVVALYERALLVAETEFQPETVAAFRLTVIEDRTAEEAAQTLGKSSAAVRMAKKRVLDRLRELLGDS